MKRELYVLLTSDDSNTLSSLARAVARAARRDAMPIKRRFVMCIARQYAVGWVRGVVMLRESSRDVFMATRASVEPFGPAIPVRELSIAAQPDLDPHLSPDACELYWATDRDGSSDLRIWVTRVFR